MHEAYHSHLLLKLPLQVESITSAGDQVGGNTEKRAKEELSKKCCIFLGTNTSGDMGTLRHVNFCFESVI